MFGLGHGHSLSLAASRPLSVPFVGPPGTFFNDGSDGQTLRWTASNSITPYSISVYYDEARLNLATGVTTTNTSYSTSGFGLPDGLYWFVVTATNSFGDTEWAPGALPLSLGDAPTVLGAQAVYLPQLNETVGVPTSLMVDSSGNGFDVTLNGPLNVVAGPGGLPVIEFTAASNGANAAIPVDTQAYTLVFAVKVEYETTFWKFVNYISASGGVTWSVLGGLPDCWAGSGGHTIDSNAINPRVSPETWSFVAITCSAVAMKGYMNNMTIDGTPLASITTTGMTYMLNIGGTTNQQVAGMVIFDKALTDAEVAYIRHWVKQTLFVPLQPPVAGGKLVIVEGDSISRGVSANTTAWPWQLPALCTGWTLRGLPVSSSTIQSMVDRLPELRPLYDSRRDKNVLIVFAGTNDHIALGHTAAIIKADTEAYCAARVAEGWEVAIVSVIARGESTYPDTWFQPYADLYRAQFGVTTAVTNVFAANSGVNYAHYFIDLAADPRFQDARDHTYYQTDNLHPNDVGQTVIATDYMGPFLNLVA